MAVSSRSAVLLITLVLGLQLATASAPAGEQISVVAAQQSLSLIGQAFSDLYELLTHDSDRSAEALHASEAAIARSKVAEDAAEAERLHRLWTSSGEIETAGEREVADPRTAHFSRRRLHQISLAPSAG